MFFLIVLAMGAMAIGLTSATEDELLNSELLLMVCENPELPKGGSSLEERVDHFYELALKRGISQIENFLVKNDCFNNNKRGEFKESLERVLRKRRSRILNRESQKSESLDGIICIGFFSCQETEIVERLHNGKNPIKKKLAERGLLEFANSAFKSCNDLFGEY